jgi:hypothetical protein
MNSPLGTSQMRRGEGDRELGLKACEHKAVGWCETITSITHMQGANGARNTFLFRTYLKGRGQTIRATQSGAGLDPETQFGSELLLGQAAGTGCPVPV